MSQTIASLIQPLFGRGVIATDKHGAETRYTIARLSDKLGTLKDGSKGEYVILTKDGDTAVVLNVHPNTAKKLATKGEGDMLKLVPAEGEAPVEATGEADSTELSDEDQQDVAAELAEAQAAVPEADKGNGIEDSQGTDAPQDEAPAVAAKEPSKKERTVALFKKMTAEGKARKDIIAVMKTELGLSAAGANTYYQNCKGGAWK